MSSSSKYYISVTQRVLVGKCAGYSGQPMARHDIIWLPPFASERLQRKHKVTCNWYRERDLYVRNPVKCKYLLFFFVLDFDNFAQRYINTGYFYNYSYYVATSIEVISSQTCNNLLNIEVQINEIFFYLIKILFYVFEQKLNSLLEIFILLIVIVTNLCIIVSLSLTSLMCKHSYYLPRKRNQNLGSMRTE